MAANTFWNKEREAQLVKMWGDGASAREIAESFDGSITRNAVIGKANRLGLSQQSKKVDSEKLISIPNSQQCQWPFGDPNDADFHFCCKPIVPDWPYCQTHCNEAYRSVGDKDDQKKDDQKKDDQKKDDQKKDDQKKDGKNNEQKTAPNPGK